MLIISALEEAEIRELVSEFMNLGYVRTPCKKKRKADKQKPTKAPQSAALGRLRAL